MANRKLTPKQHVLFAEPKATLDYSEVLRGARKRCWFIRLGLQGGYLHAGLCASPRAAWKAAYVSLLASFGKAAA